MLDLPELKTIVLGSFALSGNPFIEDLYTMKTKPVCELVMRSGHVLTLLRDRPACSHQPFPRLRAVFSE